MAGCSPGTQQPGESSSSTSGAIHHHASSGGEEVNDPNDESGLPGEDPINNSLLAGYYRDHEEIVRKS